MTAPPVSQSREIGRKKFSMRDQEVFASISFDRNPMHMDAVAARRLLTGRPVVHGIHVLMTALECLDDDIASIPLAVECTFNNAINVDDLVVFTRRNRDQGLTIEASVEGLLCARLYLRAAQPSTETDAAATLVDSQVNEYSIPSNASDAPLNEPPEFHLKKRYVVPIDAADLGHYFPRSSVRYGSKNLASLLATSYFVGMVCPGLNSIFSTLRVQLGKQVEKVRSIEFSVDEYDERFGMFRIFLSGSIVGSLTAFVRPPPRQQPTIAEVSRWVTSGEFGGTRSLVIGGSRGLGEAAAKILAAGGGDILITYRDGSSEAEALNVEINGSGIGKSRGQRFDVMSSNFADIDFEIIDMVFYFASPRIYRKKARVFVRSLFEEFIEFYVRSFHDLCLYIEGLSLGRKIYIYVPSSVFVEERPECLTEYAMAKAALEILIEDINKSFKGVSIMTTRLPRLSTDQTSSVLKAANSDTLDVLVPVVRAAVATRKERSQPD